jgi:hypothetical protein
MRRKTNTMIMEHGKTEKAKADAIGDIKNYEEETGARNKWDHVRVCFPGIDYDVFYVTRGTRQETREAVAELEKDGKSNRNLLLTYHMPSNLDTIYYGTTERNANDLLDVIDFLKIQERSYNLYKLKEDLRNKTYRLSLPSGFLFSEAV